MKMKKTIPIGMAAFLSVLLFLTVPSARPLPAQQGNPDKTPSNEAPTDEQIAEFVGHAETAMALFNVAVIAEAATSPDKAAENAKISEATSKGLAIVSADPQAFNSLLGFDLTWNLDNAAYNMVWCAGLAENQAKVALANGKKVSSEWAASGDACITASTLLVVVSEEAPKLYVHYLEDSQKKLDADEKALKDCNCKSKVIAKNGK